MKGHSFCISKLIETLAEDRQTDRQISLDVLVIIIRTPKN
jgi:hypothetical protein